MTDDRADRWLRRYEPDLPVAAWDGSLRRAVLEGEIAFRDLRRVLLKALSPLATPFLRLFSDTSHD